MKLFEAIAQTKAVKPSQFDDAQLTTWVSMLDGQLHDALMTGRADAPTLAAPYDTNDDAQTDLLVTFPYDQIYIYWLCAMIDFSNQEIDRYNNDMAMYNKLHDDFAAKYAREHVQTSNGEAVI